ncbi:MAG: tRNA (guanosine(46)-N7)-methyltransferase TrmB [Clostridia bacterium]|nr:tRNA (guanosine(46)-N7)-methyltransferase TrmB [Clostridia bacterium]
MRLRNNPEAYDRLELCSNYIQDAKSLKGQWKKHFGNDNPVHMEIGSGKGRFITTLAQRNPGINYVAIEKFPTVLLKLIRKIPEEGLQNLAVVSIDADQLEEILEPGEIEKLYLNFSDPWPKKRHAKRRLTSSSFLSLYKKVLKADALIEFKTDNRGLFDFSLEEIKNSGFELLKVTFDLYNSDMLEGNIATEYEERFHNLGTPINKLIAKMKIDNQGGASHEVHTQE